MFRVLIVTGVLCLPAIAKADGLLQQLPENGAHTRYDFELAVDGQGAPMKGSVHLKSVGIAFEGGETCRWIEMEFKMKPPDNEEQITTYKLLLPEKSLSAGKNSLEKIVRGWYRLGDGPILQLADTTSLTTAHVAVFLGGPLRESKELDKQFEDSKLGNLECPGLRGTQSLMLGDATLKVATELRKHEKAPFGVVRGEYQFELVRNGNTDAKGTLQLKLADFGKEAQSALPDSQ